MKSIANGLAALTFDLDHPTLLFGEGDHSVYWLGIVHDTPFRCNSYLIRDGEQAILVDPGSRAFFDQVKRRVSQIVAPEQVTAMVLCHQDPDVAASLPDWLEVNSSIQVLSTPRTHVLLPHYGQLIYPAVDVTEHSTLPLSSGHHLRFIEAPFLHFPGAFVTYDTASRLLFSGDIWAALDMNWRLMVECFEEHEPAMDMFHVDYMASNVAARGFMRRLDGFDIQAILPQHGSIIGSRDVPAALEYLRNLRCGLDIAYPDLD